MTIVIQFDGVSEEWDADEQYWYPTFALSGSCDCCGKDVSLTEVWESDDDVLYCNDCVNLKGQSK